MKKQRTQQLSEKEVAAFLAILKTRFEKYPKRHKGIPWAKVESRLRASPQKIGSLFLMEETGGEPDVVAYNKKTGQCTFFDCAEESPKGRRSVCFDGAALRARKEHKPENNALDMARLMGAEILSEEEYRLLQTLGEFDLKTSSWIATPDAIRKLGGPLFADRRFGQVFVYHNGAESYYAGRGFRSALKV